VHVATYIEQLSQARSAPTAKLRLTALRHLFDWMVIGQIMPTNPAAAVRGPRHVVRRGKTPVLDPAEARQLLDAIDRTTVIGLRDRALIRLMVCSFARIGAAIGMRVEDVFTRNRRLRMRLHEKGGKQHAMPCHHNLESYLHAYIDSAGLASDPTALLFQSYNRATGRLTGNPLPQANAYAMIQRRARAAEITTKIGNHLCCTICVGSCRLRACHEYMMDTERIARRVPGMIRFSHPLITHQNGRWLKPPRCLHAQVSMLAPKIIFNALDSAGRISVEHEGQHTSVSHRACILPGHKPRHAKHNILRRV
jgi:site-specific recombinase XerC